MHYTLRITYVKKNSHKTITPRSRALETVRIEISETIRDSDSMYLCATYFVKSIMGF